MTIHSYMHISHTTMYEGNEPDFFDLVVFKELEDLLNNTRCV